MIISLKVAQLIERPPGVWEVMGSILVGGSDFIIGSTIMTKEMLPSPTPPCGGGKENI